MSHMKLIAVEKIKDKRWTRADKLAQYRAILKLNARDRKLQESNASKLKKKVSRKLLALKNEVKTYNEIINDVNSGNKQRLHITLLPYKDIQRALCDLKIEEVYEVVCEDIHAKENQLNKLIYAKKRKMKALFNLQLERSTLTDKCDEDQLQPESEKLNLTKQYQHFLSKHKAALLIQKSYRMILLAIKNDAIYYDYVINLLKIDKNDQSRLVVRMTWKGQIWVENLNRIKFKYKHMLENVMFNMKERERALEIAREQVKDLWAYAQSVVRVESETEFNENRITTFADGSLEAQIQEFNDIFDKVKMSLHVRSFEELLVRFENQMEQKTCLAEQFNSYIRQRDDLLNKISHADSVLHSINHSVISTTGEYKQQKEDLNEKIVEQEEKEERCNNLIKRHGELLVDIKAALQTMLSMLVCIRLDNKSNEKTREGRRATRVLDREMMMRRRSTKSNEGDIARTEAHKSDQSENFDSLDTNSLNLLSMISRKVGVLYAMSKIDLSKEKEEIAKEAYQSYVQHYRSKLLLIQEDGGPTNISIEYDVVDDNIPTRADIKNESKDIVEAHQKDQ